MQMQIGSNFSDHFIPWTPKRCNLPASSSDGILLDFERSRRDGGWMRGRGALMGIANEGL